ncbi:U7 snRNA-associated Sm-like protein LSm10 [Eriocheir sinensis]|uniref:U7 snRNA-associated Sm-like protein LSm10 n=1 Tax=Eriocheir sinensis TaxID=95602 RepID=UPI0021C5B981|nr:U7 snRNA-associated Sm-like protein LSm10 [Eriocheir sinensis]XP_050695523.1 U7 snRNA-associated Sm-like protein LSm10 [Eriocheir sinensis]XP_050695524.1 U7 snRNA-associated Sm-like protein LSm10 [Eriocheir sinensis]XP_050695525.1 U7 snRNA-associated Sm-like protein LSm10 [Eriocheir sinensis]XP_050695526.1 U7 snRNA-associated Sm-like protein LSm10 [Eriocheir sinensis]
MGLFGRSRHRELNSLTCLAMALEGWRTTVELHNDAFVSGFVVEVDAKMNIDMQDAKYTDGNGKTMKLENFHVRGRKVRYIHIPDQLDIMETIQKKVTIKTSHQRTTKKGHIALKRTQQTLKRYRQQQDFPSTSSAQSEDFS